VRSRRFSFLCCGDTYALDAEAAGRDEHAAFFREAQAMQRDLAERAKAGRGTTGGREGHC
jgi:hypothetical protein